MVTVRDIMDSVTCIAPLNLQEDYDNSGLIIGDERAVVRNCLITLDVTEKVVDEALKKDCNLIVSHHPLIFRGLKRLTGKNDLERSVMKAIQNDISIVSMHTNLDNSLLGVNRKLADKLGLLKTRILKPMSGKLLKVSVYCPLKSAELVRNAMFEAGAGSIGNYDQCSFSVAGKGSFRAQAGTHPFVGEIGKLHLEDEMLIQVVVPDYALDKVIHAMKQVHPYEEVAFDIFQLQNDFEQVGAGMIGELEREKTEKEFLAHVCEVIGIPCLRHSHLLGKKVKTVAICGGSGFFLLPDARRNQADVFLTADVKYHEFFEADSKILLVDGGHFETEQFTKELIAELIQKKNATFVPLIAETKTNSVEYFCKN